MPLERRMMRRARDGRPLIMPSTASIWSLPTGGVGQERRDVGDVSLADHAGSHLIRPRAR